MAEGELSTGALNDLQQATALARRMVEEFGMSEAIGPVVLRRLSVFMPVEVGRTEQVSERTVEQADAEVRALLAEAETRAARILGERRADLDRVARLLLERETLEGEQLRAALTAPVAARPSRPAPSGVEARCLRVLPGRETEPRHLD